MCRFASLLGLFDSGAPLFANASAANRDARLFRLPVVSPYAGNVALALYTDGQAGGKAYVKLLYNEVEVVVRRREGVSDPVCLGTVVGACDERLC